MKFTAKQKKNCEISQSAYNFASKNTTMATEHKHAQKRRKKTENVYKSFICLDLNNKYNSKGYQQ